MHTYEKRYKSDGSYDVYQIRNDNNVRLISEGHQAYQKYLDDGNEPTIVEYTEPSFSLEELKLRKLNEITQARRTAESTGVTYGGKTHDTDRDVQARISLAAFIASQDETYTINWKTADGTFVQLSASEIIELAQTIRDHIQAAFDHEKLLVDEVTAATDETGLDGITWDT